MHWQKIFPILTWLPQYQRQDLSQDMQAGLIASVLLLPQSLAYSVLAGVPVHFGLLATIIALLVYSLFGSSRTLSIGPIAITSILTLSIAKQYAVVGSSDYLIIVALLALSSGIMQIILGLLRFGFLANLISQPVNLGFILASVILIISNQLPNMLGVNSLSDVLATLNVNANFIIGVIAFIFLLFIRFLLAKLSSKLPFFRPISNTIKLKTIIKFSPLLLIIFTTIVIAFFDLSHVKVIGQLPTDIFNFDMNVFSNIPSILAHINITTFFANSLSISIIGFISGLSIAQDLAFKKGQKIQPNQELIAVGLSNVATGVLQTLPVAGGFSRTIINDDAGAKTPLAGAFTAFFTILIILFAGTFLQHIAVAVLAAIIIVAVLPLIDFLAIKNIFKYQKSDLMTLMLTIIMTLTYSLQIGLLSGVISAVLFYIARIAKPHTAVLGKLPHSEHFRNIKHYQVETKADRIFFRIDENLYFLNSQSWQDAIYHAIHQQPNIKHFILVCSSINQIDFTASHHLMQIQKQLQDLNIKFHFSEVKEPVLKQLKKNAFFENFNGQIFISNYQAWQMK
ncbi:MULTISPECIES: SulP family inorganic anion transporter [unclassified Acinetobacter]|uniref:SulP family inorganic anion transporter n=1 Tax=unclassified Acinetobacter TaxID=196816 RepID=UPI0035B89C1B